MRVAIYGSRRQQGYMDEIGEFLRALSARGIEIVMHRNLYTHLVGAIPTAMAGVCRVVDSSDFVADCAVSIGGDGTFLRTAMWVGSKELPIIGVNTGHLGYLSALSVGDLALLPDLIESGEYKVEPRGLIRVDCDGVDTNRFWPYALNEVVVAKEETASMISAEVTVDGHHLATYRADGLLVCTSTGSTAYNLSIGGPIVQPTVDVRVISPIAAHSLSMRPLVVDVTSRVVIVPDGRASRVRLSLDGRSTLIPVGSRISLSQAPFVVMVVQLQGHSFADTLRQKLHWADTN